MAIQRSAWTEEEQLVVFRFYCTTPFGKLHQQNPDVIELARRLGRTPGSVAMKACNYASLDPQQRNRGTKGLANVSRSDRDLWEAFNADSEAVALRAQEEYEKLFSDEVESALLSRDQRILERAEALGEYSEGTATVAVRRVQSFFRKAVLAAYDYRCAITGLAVPELLTASHIIPWSAEPKLRADPRNGICLNALHDRAFDRGLITFDESGRVAVSPLLAEDAIACVLRFGGRNCLRSPSQFPPPESAMEYHRERVFRRV